MQLAALVNFVWQLPFFRNDDLKVIRVGIEEGGDGVGRALYDGMEFKGAVDPSRSTKLMRMLEGHAVSGGIVVVTDVPLMAGSEIRDADVIGWNGRRYQVATVSDFAEGGVGIREVACTLIGANPAA